MDIRAYSSSEFFSRCATELGAAMACANALGPQKLFNCEEHQKKHIICVSARIRVARNKSTKCKRNTQLACAALHSLDSDNVKRNADWEPEKFKAEVGKALQEKIAALERQGIEDTSKKAEKLAILAVEEILSRGSKLKDSIAKTALTDANLSVEKSINEAANGAASSLITDLKAIIDEANEAIHIAKQRARKAEETLAQKLSALDAVVSSEVALETSVSRLKEELESSKQEVERLRAEAENAKGRAKAAEVHADKVQAQVFELRKEQEKRLLEQADKFSSTVESLRLAASVREASIKEAFEAHASAFQAAVEASQKAGKLNEEANSRRFRALESSLAAAEASILAWRERALHTEGLIQQEHADLAGPSGRVARLLGTAGADVTDTLSNGPRRETPEWMKRRIQGGLQGIPPKRYYVDVQDDPTSQLPSVNEVWSVARAKVKQDDLFSKEVVAKEALNKQRRDLEQALETAVRRKKASEKESGTGSGNEIVFQGFNWESCRKRWYLDLASKASDLSQSGITTVWLPPPTQSVSPQGYMPGDLYDLNSAYGTVSELKHCIEEMHKHDLLVLGDVVLNHRCAQKQSANGVWNVFSGKLAWGPEAIVGDDPNFQGQGKPSSGEIFHAAPNIDHSQDFVRRDIKEYLQWLKREIGFDGWRLDFVRGFWGGYVKEYIEATDPAFAIGEYWDSLQYEGGNLSYNQDAHRQRIINWINATGGTSSAFDVTTKGILHAALHDEYWRLIDPQQKPPGVMGWWPSRAVTFLENHDTGSTQGHWPFPRDKLMQGHAYILTHPGTPVVFYDHFYDFGLRDPIVDLIAARKRADIHCRSIVKILHAVKEGYVAKVGDNLVVKLGYLDWNPSKQNDLIGNWEKTISQGAEYQVWERR